MGDLRKAKRKIEDRHVAMTLIARLLEDALLNAVGGGVGRANLDAHGFSPNSSVGRSIVSHYNRATEKLTVGFDIRGVVSSTTGRPLSEYFVALQSPSANPIRSAPPNPPIIDFVEGRILFPSLVGKVETSLLTSAVPVPGWVAFNRILPWVANAGLDFGGRSLMAAVISVGTKLNEGSIRRPLLTKIFLNTATDRLLRVGGSGASTGGDFVSILRQPYRGRVQKILDTALTFGTGKAERFRFARPRSQFQVLARDKRGRFI